MTNQSHTELAAQRAAFEREYEAYCQPAEADWFRREDDDPDEYYHVTTKEAWWGWQASWKATAPALPEQVAQDSARLDWLTEQLVDTIYLDDGRIIDVGTGRIGQTDVRVSPHALRSAIDAARARGEG